ncbi:MAG TPA: hypothetical protein VEI97_19230, partial [bacterium]|nr:hypothetical protein [bacterium]
MRLTRTLPLLAGLSLILGCTGFGPQLPSPPADSAPETGAPGDPFLWYDPAELEGPLTRKGTAEITGSVTLNGATTTSPTYSDAPFDAMVSGKAGDLMLVTVAATATPSASNSVLVGFQGATTSYGSLPYPTNGATNYLPLYLTKTEAAGVRLHNSATAGGALHNQAVSFAGSITTIPREDTGEPNDDGNVLSYTDRTMASSFPVGATRNRSFFQRTATTNEDREDWYRLDLKGGNRYRIDL